MSTNIRYIGSLSGTIDLAFYTDRDGNTGNGLTPGVLGRVTLALDAGGAIPGV